jgi:hypothetical protein
MSEFKTNDNVVLLKEGTKDYLLQIIDHKYTDDLYRVTILETGQCGPVFKDEIRLATKEEIEIGRRINCPHGYDVACLLCGFGTENGERVYHNSTKRKRK